MALKLRLVTPNAVGRFKLRELLSPRELIAFYRLKSQKRRRDWLAGRLAAKELLCAHLASSGCHVSLGQIELYPTSCFRLLGEDLNISIAHSHGYGLCGLAHTQEDGYIGVDIERIRPIRRAVQRRFLTSAEMKRIKQLGLEGAVLLWALKEAAFKALYKRTVESPKSKSQKSCGLRLFDLRLLCLEAEGRAVLAYYGQGLIAKGVVLSAAYRRHANFFLAWTLVPPV